jgi:transcriptional antiterminator RfaH
MHPITIYPGSYSWYVIHTKPCQEERAVENLAAWGVETLAPWLDKRRTFGSKQPLFPSYIFARFDAAQMLYKVNFTRGVSCVVNFGGAPAVVGEDIMAALRSRMNEDGFVRLERTFRPGDAVVIQSGPLRNLVGIFQTKLTGSERVQILLTSVAFKARVEVDPSELAPTGTMASIPTRS